MEGDTGHRSTLGSDCSPHKHELQLVNIDTSGEQASSPTCPLNLLVPSKVDLELSDPFLSGGGGGAGDRTAPSSGYAVPTDQLVDFREKGSREADGSDRGDDGDLQLIADDALGMSGEADMDNIFQEALALADEFSELDKQDDADISLVDSAPQSLPGESELLSLDAALLAALAESRRELPPYRPRGLADSALDSSFPVPAAAPAPTPGPFTVSSLRSASAAAVAQAASAAASLLPPPPAASSSLPGAEPSVPSPAPASAPSSAGGPHSSPRPAAPAAASPDRPGPAAAASSRLAGRRRASPAAASPPASPPPAADRREASTAPPPPAAAGSAYADLCQQASAEQRELELQADEEYENRQFEQMERQVSRDEQDGPPPAGDKSQPHPRSQLARKETYICRPNTGTFKIDKKQRFGTFKVDKTGTFKVPRQAASAARSLPPEPDPAPAPADGTNGRPEPEPEQEPEAEGPRASTPGRSVNGDLGVPSADSMNTYCDYADDEFGERSPSPSRAPLSTSTPEREDAGRAAPRRPAGLRRPLTSTPCRSAGSSGSSIGVTPIRAPPAGSLTGPEDSPAPAPAAALRGAALRQPAGPGLRQPAAATTGLRKPAASGLKQPAASGLRQPAASGLRQPAASGLRQPAASGLRQPAASGLRQPAASGLRQPAASGLRPPSASGLRAPSAAAAAPRSAPGRQTAAQLRQSSAQSGSDSSVCSVRSLPGPNTSRSNPSLAADRSESEAPSLRQPRQLPGPSSRLPARGGVRRSAGGTGSLTNISLQASHTAPGGSRRPNTARNRAQETSKLSLSQQPAGSERF